MFVEGATLNTQNKNLSVIAGVFLIIGAVLSSLYHIADFCLVFQVQPTADIIFRTMFPYKALFFLCLIAAGILTLAKKRMGTGACLILTGVFSYLSMMPSPRMLMPAQLPANYLMSFAIPALMFVFAGIICLASSKLPRSSVIAILPAIGYLLADGYRTLSRISNMSFMIPRNSTVALFCLLQLVCCLTVSAGLLLVCMWALSKETAPATSKAIPAPPAQPGFPVSPTVSASPTWFCPQCGNPGNTGKFCIRCGTKVPDRFAEVAQPTTNRQ